MASLPPKESTASFWHSEPSSFLLNHQTTLDLPDEADVVIVGSGITGASAARYLYEDERAKDMKVVMLEAREACWGATGRNGGHCQPLLLDRPPDVVAFEIRNLETVESYIQQHNVQCEWKTTDSCRSVWTHQLADHAENALQQLEVNAPDLASRAKIVKDFTTLRQDFRLNNAPQAMLVTKVGQLWPYKLIAFILERTIRAGRLNLQTNTPTTFITQTKSRDGSTRQLVTTPRGTISARHVILATNGYTSHLLPEFADLILPERGMMSALLPPRNCTPLRHSYGFRGADGAGPGQDGYLIQRPSSGVANSRGHLMFGGGEVAARLDNLGTTDDSVIDEGSALYLRQGLLRLLELDGETEGSEELKVDKQWSGIWGTSRDKIPWVGSVPGRRGVWLAAGYSGHGMPNGTLCGKAVVEMVFGQESGAPADYVEERLVRTGELPQSYLISEERVERCQKMETVREQYVRGWELHRTV